LTYYGLLAGMNFLLFWLTYWLFIQVVSSFLELKKTGKKWYVWLVGCTLCVGISIASFFMVNVTVLYLARRPALDFWWTGFLINQRLIFRFIKAPSITAQIQAAPRMILLLAPIFGGMLIDHSYPLVTFGLWIAMLGVSYLSGSAHTELSPI